MLYQRLLLEYRKIGLRDYQLLNDYFEAGKDFGKLEELAKERIKKTEERLAAIRKEIEEELEKLVGKNEVYLTEKKDLNTQQNNLKNGEAKTNH